MNYFIRGGGFDNKGAEAMTLIAIYNICKKDNDAKIYILNTGYDIPFEFINNVVFFETSSYLIDCILGRRASTVKVLKEAIKLCIPRKKSYLFRDMKTLKIIKSIDYMIDISGYELSSRWGQESYKNYTDWINIMTLVGAEIYLLPQSFGPFQYKKEINSYITECLSKCKKIYARESFGFNELEKLGLMNVYMSLDSVLIEKAYNPSDVIRNIHFYEENFEIHKKSVGIIPNIMLIAADEVSEDELLNLYKSVIGKLLSKGYTVYLIPHSSEDISLCADVKAEYKEDNEVVLINHVLYSFNYEKMISVFDFIIASRYHSIVHAYKEAVPAIILGWAEKYESLAEAFDQKQYIIETKHLDSIYFELDKMIEKSDSEHKRIMKKLAKYKETTCYDFLDMN